MLASTCLYSLYAWLIIKIALIVMIRFFNCMLTHYLWPPYVVGQAIYIFILWYLLLFFPRVISAVGDLMSTILPHMVWP